RLLPPEQVGHQADEAGFGELVRVPAHGVVDTPDFHDGDDGAGGRLVRIGDIGAHGAVTEFDLDVLGSHSVLRPISRNISGVIPPKAGHPAWIARFCGRHRLYSFKSVLALPAKIFSFSAADISSAFTAAIVLRIK